MLNKVCPMILVMLLFIQTIGMASTVAPIAHAAESDVPKVLSGNTLGQLFRKIHRLWILELYIIGSGKGFMRRIPDFSLQILAMRLT